MGMGYFETTWLLEGEILVRPAIKVGDGSCLFLDIPNYFVHAVNNVHFSSVRTSRRFPVLRHLSQ